MIVSAGVGIACVVCGLLLSWHLDVAAGATMALLGVVAFFAVLAGQEAAARLRRGRSHAEASLDGAVI
jgi:zinc/manganese transport system permease protein